VREERGGKTQKRSLGVLNILSVGAKWCPRFIKKRGLFLAKRARKPRGGVIRERLIELNMRDSPQRELGQLRKRT